MSESVVCEHCGKVVDKHVAQTVVVDDWPHYFCSEPCKIEWAEQGEIEEEVKT